MSIDHRDPDGDFLVRENVILCFFSKRAPAEIAPAVRRIVVVMSVPPLVVAAERS